jgi:hypothetical protein
MNTQINHRNTQFTYPQETIKRGERSLICSPFNLNLFVAMAADRIAMSEITGEAGIKQGYTKRVMSELAVDNAVVWLIQVGILRREVDGQGITDSFRLTPLGQLLVEKFQSKPWRDASLFDYISDGMTRWLRFPF